ncbi:MAG: disulfide bond formation protein B [Candidatus Buchananbacteria bacterium CG10_big_fil_rev_8_21_14_0_10_42_9]|uniref:Disulfide bond formation protein B n=1 Tax=Candidatus Buchananbacteria bacterium CG10_big_fil_rev_8_21_14_0_10_42_9 TaxID=1974526 RepID=A0A2H0W1G3_9BACT|nr:MAG: disulfide bond formation protein B [Candidatus Buchananbacteria bacterium CG10_big_fil_rev_8_21_14_0_10_42_9]
MELSNNLTLVISIGTIATQIAIGAILVSIFLTRNGNKNSVIKFFGSKAIFFAFLVALIGTLGSLAYSDIVGFEPCLLCWYQRTMMYPMVVILAYALWKKSEAIAFVTIPLSVIGAGIAGIQYFGQMTGSTLTSCAGIGYSASCSIRYFLSFGYITIPMMALTGFLMIIALMLALMQYNKK